MANKQNNKRKRNNMNTKSRGRQCSRNQKELREARTEVDVNDSSNVNDSSYYYTDDNIRNQVTNYSFNQFLGVPVDIAHSDKLFRYDVPAIMRISLCPSAGFTSDVAPMTSGINMAGMKNYTILSANNAKTTQYGPQDVTLLILALGSVCSIVGYCTRTLGMAYLYNQRNRVYPIQALKATGIDGHDLLNNLAEYRIRFNTLVSMVNKIPFFADLKYFEKSLNIYAGVYTDDADSAMAQSYVMVPETTWVYKEDYGPEGGGLVTTPVIPAGDSTTFKTVLDVFESQINALLNSSLLNYVYSDVLRILDKEGRQRIVFATVPENYGIVPVYNPELSLYINNMLMHGVPIETPDSGFTKSNDVLSNPDFNAVKYRPQFVAFDALGISGIINFPTETPGIEDRIAATRFSSRFQYITPPAEKLYKTSAAALPDYYPVRIVMYDGISNPQNNKTTHNSIDKDSYVSSPNFIGAVSQFDYAPLIYVTDTSKTDNALVTIIGDLQYFTTLDYSFMKQMYDVEYMSEFELR